MVLTCSASGRYLSPEPLLQNPRKVAEAAQSGYLTAMYAYARGNPISAFDPDGNWPWEFRNGPSGKHWYWGYEGAVPAPVQSCKCHLRVFERPGAWSDRCYFVDASLAAHGSHPDGDSCPFNGDPQGDRGCKDFCYDAAREAFDIGTVPPVGMYGWTPEACLLPPADRARQYLGSTP